MPRRHRPHRKEPVIVSPPQVEHHRWQGPAPDQRGLAPLDEDTRALLRAWRGRPPPREPWRLRFVPGAVLALHVLFAAVVWWQMRPLPPWQGDPVHSGQALQVRLIPGPRRAAPAPPVPPPPPALPSAPDAAEPSARHATTARPASAPKAAPHLYDRTGRVLLPATTASVAVSPVPGYVQRLPQGDTQVMRHDSPIPYQATRFEDAFAPPDETIVGQGVRSVLRATHTNESKAVNLGHGVHLQCKTLLGVPTPFCTMPPAPPSKKDGDERLNMAPAAPLAKELAAPPHDLADCIARYRAGKPLPYGCPVDTPRRAVDAECRDARRAGKPLPDHCPAGKPGQAYREARDMP